MTLEVQIPKEVNHILKILNENGFEAWVVGGCVRDSLIGRPIHDWDITTSAIPAQIMNIFKNDEEVIRIIPTGIKHGTVTLMINNTGYEVTTYRIDGEYSDGRHPDSVTFVSDLREDLSRRDFTINAMAYHPKRGFVDPFDGLKDLRNKIIRCVGDPADRFIEDPLRILRAWRFSLQLGFDLNEETKNDAYALRYKIKNISAERIHAEFVNAIMADKKAFAEKSSPFLVSFIPEWAALDMEQNNPWHIYTVLEHTMKAFENLPEDADKVTRLAVLFHDIGKPDCYTEDENGRGHFYGHPEVSKEKTIEIMERLRFDNSTKNAVAELVGYHDAVIIPDKKHVRRWLNRIGEIQLRRLIEVKLSDSKAHNTDRPETRTRIAELEQFKAAIDIVMEEDSCFSLKDMAVSGKDLLGIGFKTGKPVGECLNYLLDSVMNEELENKKEILLQTAAVWLKERNE